VLLLAALAAQAAPVPPLPKAIVQATATVRIQRPSTVSGESWDRSPPEMKREVVVWDERGQPMLLRLIENQ
jgi:hypothetical protein